MARGSPETAPWRLVAGRSLSGPCQRWGPGATCRDGHWVVACRCFSGTVAARQQATATGAQFFCPGWLLDGMGFQIQVMSVDHGACSCAESVDLVLVFRIYF